jgi:hypothetical protein
MSQKEIVVQVIQQCTENGTLNKQKALDTLEQMFQLKQVHIGSPSKAISLKSRRDYFSSAISHYSRQSLTTSSSRGTTMKKPRPADAELKKLIMSKVQLQANALPTDHVDQLIAEREQEVVTQRVKEVKKVEAEVLELLQDINTPL